MTLDDFMGAVLQVVPGAIFAENTYGEIVVATGFMTDSDGNMVPFEIPPPFEIGGQQ
jgi:hypothetical protein